MTYDELEKAVENNKGYALQLARKLQAAVRVIEEQGKRIQRLEAALVKRK